ncbi:hypothetical protein ACE1TF_11940 [Geomicrobium sp. JSM 1781026]|uniref:hypothetical protein n=1 Tax=Geomicrobium sp. JSM 1781026 TaxID=3344580 RepID=UPI0035C16275
MQKTLISIGFKYVAPKTKRGVGFFVVTHIETGARLHVVAPYWLRYIVGGGYVSADVSMGSAYVPADILRTISVGGQQFKEVVA